MADTRITREDAAGVWVWPRYGKLPSGESDEEGLGQEFGSSSIPSRGSVKVFALPELHGQVPLSKVKLEM